MKYLESILGAFLGTFLFFVYLAGWVIAKGPWETIGCIFPIYPFYLVTREVIKTFGLF